MKNIKISEETHKIISIEAAKLSMSKKDFIEIILKIGLCKENMDIVKKKKLLES